MEALFYDSKLEKIIPCLLKENEMYDERSQFSRQYYVRVTFDASKFTEYNVTREELMRYSSEFVPLNDLYPATSSLEIDYALSTVPKHFATVKTPFLVTFDHNIDELNRFEKLVNMIVNDSEISSDVFYKLFEFINYELLFINCTDAERDFIRSLYLDQLTDQPPIIYVPQMIRMNKLIFSKFTNLETGWKIGNYKNFSEFDSELPFRIELPTLEYNVNFIIL